MKQRSFLLRRSFTYFNTHRNFMVLQPWTKYLEQSEEIKLKHTWAENFDNCFRVIYEWTLLQKFYFWKWNSTLGFICIQFWHFTKGMFIWRKKHIPTKWGPWLSEMSPVKQHFVPPCREFLFLNYIYNIFNPLSANPTKWLNIFYQFVGNLPRNCLSVFDHFVGLELKGLKIAEKHLAKSVLKTKVKLMSC